MWVQGCTASKWESWHSKAGLLAPSSWLGYHRAVGIRGLSPAEGCAWPESGEPKDGARNRSLGTKPLDIFQRKVKWNEQDGVQRSTLSAAVWSWASARPSLALVGAPLDQRGHTAGLQTAVIQPAVSPILHSLLSWIERFHVKIQISGFFHKTGWSRNSGLKSSTGWSSVAVTPSTYSLLSPAPPSLCPSTPHSFSGQTDMNSSALSLMTISLHVSQLRNTQGEKVCHCCFLNLKPH